MPRLRLGKIERRLLENLVLRKLGATRRDILVGPAYGEDAAVIKVGGERLVVSADPITGAGRMVGWLSVHINANDVAVAGGRPRWFSPIILLPEDSSEEDLGMMVDEIDRASRELGVAVATGHTEVAPGITHPIIAGFMVGPLVSSKPIRSSGARKGDLIVMWGWAGVEGTAILAQDMAERLRGRLPQKVLENASRLMEKISVVRPALRLARRNIANAMHDPTEGGVLGGVYEMAEASGRQIRLYGERIPVAEETREICRVLGCDPLRLISSGALIASVPRRYAGLLHGFKVVGEVGGRGGGVILVREGGEERVDEPPQDELWRLLEEAYRTTF